LTDALGGNICLATYLVRPRDALAPGIHRRHPMAAKKTKTKRAKKPAAKKAGKVAKKRTTKKKAAKKA